MIDIIIPTYNQEKYIVEAVSSALKQETQFPFQIIIRDDCSTDQTFSLCSDLASKYPEIITLSKNANNLGLAKNYEMLFRQCNSRYIAILEGDDFWTDPKKLDRQISFLEKNDEYCLIHGGCTNIYENGDLKVNLSLYNSSKQGIPLLLDIIENKYQIVPATVCIRSSTLKNYVDIGFCAYNSLKTIDFFMWTNLVTHGKFFFDSNIVACYRVLHSSESNNINLEKYHLWWESGMLTLDYLKKKYNINPRSLIISGNNACMNAIRIGILNNNSEFTIEKSRQIRIVGIKTFCFKFFSLFIIGRSLLKMYFGYLKKASNLKQYLYSILKSFKKK